MSVKLSLLLPVVALFFSALAPNNVGKAMIRCVLPAASRAELTS